MAVLLIDPNDFSKQSFIDNEAVNRLARNSHTVKRVERGPMQHRYTLTMAYTDDTGTHDTSCNIVTNVPSDADDILRIATRARK